MELMVLGRHDILTILFHISNTHGDVFSLLRH
jgi:hypothetical protein